MNQKENDTREEIGEEARSRKNTSFRLKILCRCGHAILNIDRLFISVYTYNCLTIFTRDNLPASYLSHCIYTRVYCSMRTWITRSILIWARPSSRFLWYLCPFYCSTCWLPWWAIHTRTLSSKAKRNSSSRFVLKYFTFFKNLVSTKNVRVSEFSQDSFLKIVLS